MKGSLIILSFFTAGLLLSFYHIIPPDLLKEEYSSYALYFLMFLVGVGVGADTKAL